MTDALKSNPKLQPVYEVIKREDLAGAFRDALKPVGDGIVASIENIVTLYAATQPPALWVWDFSSRWDFDMWW